MTIAPADFEYVQKLVHERAAIVLEPGKEYLAESRLLAVARREGLGSLAELVARLRGERWNPLHRKVVEAMTTNETSFFRDAHPFDALRRRILPEVLERRAAERVLRIWSAASSSGQEAYSIAMLLREEAAALRGWQVGILGTDLSAEMVARARAGRFSQLEVNRGLPATFLARYFRRRGMEWEIDEAVRGMVEFREMNLADAWPVLPEMDVVFMRNVLIYFDLDTKRAVLARVRRVLRPGGYLFLGGAETTINLDDGFERVVLDQAPAYRPRAS